VHTDQPVVERLIFSKGESAEVTRCPDCHQGKPLTDFHLDAHSSDGRHLRTTNAIESTFATVRLRTNKTKGAGSRSAGLAMAYKLLEAAQARWRCVNAPHLVALVRAGATFVDGFIIEREDQRYAA
jgi:transposase-like protein